MFCDFSKNGKSDDGNMFGVKDPVPDWLCSREVYKFACAGLMPVMSAKQSDVLSQTHVGI